MPLNHDAVVAHLKQGAQRRTDALLAHCAQHPNREWNWLHGILCASHCFDSSDDGVKDRQLVDAMFDGMRIATRLDDLNAQAVADYNASKGAA